MAVSSVSGDQTSLSLVDLMYEAQMEAAPSLTSSSGTLASSEALVSSIQSKRAQNAYSGGSAASSIGQAALQRALSEMPGNAGKVTFKQVADYREQLELEFSLAMRADLALAGVSLDTEFSLTMSTDGKIDVVCDDPVAREKIRKYLEENPKMCEQFGYIQALGNLERARQGPAGSMAAWQEVRNNMSEMQSEALEAFFNDAMNSGSMDYTSILANFGAGSSGSASFYTGLDFTV